MVFIEKIEKQNTKTQLILNLNQVSYDPLIDS